MSRAKKDSPALLYLLGAAAILLMFVFSCGLMALIYFSQSQPILPGADGAGSGQGAGQAGGAGNGSGGGIGLNTSGSNISADDMALWNSIDAENVQQACLMKAKEEAGESADMVYGCICDESASAAEKAYQCEIATADPFTDYFADIRCSLMIRACSVETNYGTANVSFEELRGLYTE